MGAGAFAGMFGTVLTHPMDVIRAKLTIQSQQSKMYRGRWVGVHISYSYDILYMVCYHILTQSDCGLYVILYVTCSVTQHGV